MKIKVVTFYTDSYRPYGRELVRSAEDVGVKVIGYEVAKIPPFTWHQAVSHKPQFILERLEELSHHEDCGLLWVDADALFRRKPDFSIFDHVDFSACLFQWSPSHPLEMLTGTLFFRNTPYVVDFVRQWIAATERWKLANRDTPEQISLKETWEFGKTSAHPLRFLDLPKEWVWIEPEFRQMFVDKTPVISHLQASRTFKS